MTIHIGILGGGNISETHTRAVQEIDGAKVAAVYGQSLERVRGLAQSTGAVAYETLNSFLDHKPLDIVLIGSPSGLHAAQGIEAARRGMHVLVEKPLAITTDQANELIAECATAGVKLGVFFQDRVAGDIVRLKELIDSGTLGKPHLASARIKWYRPPAYYGDSHWRGTWALDGGGALMNQGIHTVDLLLWLLGDVAAVWAKAITAVHDIEVEDTLVAGLQFANGAVGTLEAATSVYPGYPRRLEITGPEGTAIIENDRLISVHLRSESPEAAGRQEPARDERVASPVISDVRGHRRIIEDFLEAITADRPPLCDGREGRRSVELVQAIYQASQTDATVVLATRRG